MARGSGAGTDFEWRLVPSFEEPGYPQQPEPGICVGLPVGNCLYVKGKLRICQVISGALECLGYVMNEEDDVPRDIFSPRGYSLLCIEAVVPSEKKESKKLRVDLLDRLGITPDPESTCWVILSHLETPWTRILDEYLLHCHGQTFRQRRREAFAPFARDSATLGPFPEAVEKRLDVNFYHDLEIATTARFYSANPEWESAVKGAELCSVRRPPRILVAGGKGVGKSTFVRYLTNRLLTRNLGPVLVVDLDPGQSEFTLPGCISCVRVSKPVLGPNFCHLVTDDNGDSIVVRKCINLGEINMSNIPGRYARGVTRLLRHCHSDEQQLPWIVNTMGFSNGLGVRFIRRILNQVHPTNVVEIRSRFDRKNYKLDLGALSEGKDFDVLRFDAMPESAEAKDMGVKDLWGIPEPAKLRDMVILSYLGQLRPSPLQHHHRLQSVTPYQVSWTNVSVQLLRHDNEAEADAGNVAKLLNMSLVSLGVAASLPEASNTISLIHPEYDVTVKGFGFVRAVDVRNRLFYVVTPLQPDTLSSINCLSVGAVVLPSGIIRHQAPRPKDDDVIRTPYRQVKRRKAANSNPLSAPWQRYSKPMNC